MKDDITDETIDPAMQKSVTDWLAKVISGNKPAGPNVNGHEQEKAGQEKSAKPEVAARPEAVSTLEPAVAPKTAKRETAAKRGSAAKSETAAADAPMSVPAAEPVLSEPEALQVAPPVVEAAAPAETEAPQNAAPVGEVIASEASASATAVTEAPPENAATTVEPEVSAAAEAVSEPPVVDVFRDGLTPLEPPMAEVEALTAPPFPEKEITVRDILRDSELEADEPEVAEPAVAEPAAEAAVTEAAAVEPAAVEAEASVAAVSDEPQIEPEAVELGPVEPELVEPEAVEPKQPVEAEAAEAEAVGPESVETEAVDSHSVEPELVGAEVAEIEPAVEEPVAVEAEERVAAVGMSPEPEAEVEPAEPVFEPVAAETLWVEPVAAEPEAVEAGESVAAFDLSGGSGRPQTAPESVELEPAAAAENVFARKGFLWGPERRKSREMGEATYQGPERRRPLPKELKEIQERPESWDAAWTTLMRLGTALPSLARAMESGTVGEPETGLSHDVQREVADMRLSQFELRTAVQDHSQHLKRVEDQLTRIRESLDSDSGGNSDLENTVKSTVKLVRVWWGLSVGALLAVLILMVAILMAHGSR